MTHFHYYATTAGKTDRMLQYAIYPISLLLAYELGGRQSSVKAGHIAQLATTLSSAAMTTTFFSLESDMIDQDSRTAIAAEMGRDPKDLKFSDYKNSDNIIVRRAYSDLMHLQKYRYMTDALFILPAVVDQIYKVTHGKHLQSLGNGHSKLDMNQVLRDVTPGLAGKSAYWFYETFMVDKTSHYEVVKIRENLEATGKSVKADDLLAVYQRARDDLGMGRIDRPEEYAAIMPLLEKIANAYDKHDGKMGMPEIVYLIGLGKINIYEPDNKTVSQAAVAQSHKEIDHVLEVGLEGIRQENCKRREAGDVPRYHTFASNHAKRKGGFVEALVDSAFETTKAVRKSLLAPRRPEEYVTRRDPSEVTTLASRTDNINFTGGRA